jgi:hypothetical protein
MKHARKIIVCIASLIFVLPALLRINKPLPGIESYYFINQFSSFPEFAFRIIPLAFGALSAVVFFFLLKKLGFGSDVSYISTVLLLVSTPFIYNSVMFTPHCLFFLMVLTAFYLFMREEKCCYLLSVPLFLAGAMFDFYALIIILGLISYSVFYKKRVGMTFSLSVAVLIFMLASLPANWFSPAQDYLQLLISDFGGELGIGISTFILAAYGFFRTWGKKHQLGFIYVAVLLFFVSCNYFFFMPIYLNVPVVIFSAIALNDLLKRKWELAIIKQMSLIALACTFLFSSVSYVNRMATAEPDDEIVKSLVFLKSSEPGVVFSHPDKGFWIQYYSEKPTFADRLAMDSTLQNIASELYYSRSFDNSTKILGESKIRYIWIDNQMKTGQVWTKPEQGLLFLFVDRTLFTQIYDKNSIEIWEYHSMH